MATSAAAARPPVLRSRPLGALLAAEVLSTTGSMMTGLIYSVLTLRPPPAVRAKALTAMSTASSLGTPLALAVAAPAFAAFGSRHVIAVAAAGQLAAMSYAALVTLRHLARESP